MDILLIGRIAEAETLRHLKDSYEAVRDRLPESFIRRGVASLEASFVTDEAVELLNGNTAFMYMAGEEGILDSLWYFAEELGSGLMADMTKIEISGFVVAVSELFSENPYKGDSTGCILAATECGTMLESRLREMGIPARVIGYLTEGRDRCIMNNGIRRFLTGKESGDPDRSI